MSYPTKDDLAANDVVLRFETNQIISPAAFGTVLREIERIARLKGMFGPDVEIGIVDMGTGSAWARIRIGLTIAAEVAAIAGFGLVLSDYIQRERGALAEAVATLAIDDSVVEARIVTREKTITIATHDLPARMIVEAKRALAEGRPVSGTVRMGGYGRDYGRDYGGARSGNVQPPTLGRVINGGTMEPVRAEDEANMGIIRGRGGVAFSGSGDLRAARYYLGTLRRGREEDHIVFETETPASEDFDVVLAPEIAGNSIPFDVRVAIKAELQREPDIAYVWDISIISQV